MNWHMLEKSIRMILLVTSPQFRTLLEDSMRVLYNKALKTENPWDDWFVEFLCKILMINLEKKIVKE